MWREKKTTVKLVSDVFHETFITSRKCMTGCANLYTLRGRVDLKTNISPRLIQFSHSRTTHEKKILIKFAGKSKSRLRVSKRHRSTKLVKSRHVVGITWNNVLTDYYCVLKTSAAGDLEKKINIALRFHRPSDPVQYFWFPGKREIHLFYSFYFFFLYQICTEILTKCPDKIGKEDTAMNF